jgi:hypothetical protein
MDSQIIKVIRIILNKILNKIIKLKEIRFNCKLLKKVMSLAIKVRLIIKYI